MQLGSNVNLFEESNVSKWKKSKENHNHESNPKGTLPPELNEDQQLSMCQIARKKAEQELVAL